MIHQLKKSSRYLKPLAVLASFGVYHSKCDQEKKGYKGMGKYEINESHTIENDDPFERTFTYSNRTVASLKYEELRSDMLLHMAKPLSLYALGCCGLYYFKFKPLIIPVALYYIYSTYELWVEFQMVLTKVELDEDQKHAKFTLGMFIAKEYDVVVSESHMVQKYYSMGHRMNYFQGLTRTNEKFEFVRFEYDNTDSDPLNFTNKGLFHDIVNGRPLDAYSFTPPSP